MPATPPSQPTPDSGGIHIGDVGGSVNFSALGDIVGGDKITTITTTIQISVEAVTQRPLITASPYRGLDRFEDRDKDLFFGRDQLIKSLLAQLSASNVLLVLGASGSGKSSVVRAGLLPQLAQLIGARFRYFTFVPDVNPFESLRAALLAAGFNQAQTRELADARPETATQLIHTLQRNGDQWLFFVDQFEEVFTVGDEKLRASFIAALVAIAQDPSSSTKLVLAMRADFLDRFSPFPQFAKIIEKNIDFVADMHADELRQAIEQPAARHGVVFEQGLVEEIIKDVQGQAGSLPLLQYTLDLLWQEEAREDGLADRHLNARAYRELGGVRGALQKRADEIYAEFGDGSDAKAATPKQEIVRQIFLRLVDLAGEGANDAAWRPVRRRGSMTLFTATQEQEILQALINQKLLVSNREGDDATVEVAHEALFTSWGRLKNWIEAGKQVIFARNRLGDDARRWQRRQQAGDAASDEELVGGSRLAQALDMRARGDFLTVVGGLGETETQFLDASLALRDRRVQEEQLRQQRELEAAQRLAAVQRIAATRLRKGLAVAVLLLLAAIGSGIVAYRNADKAKKNATKAKETSVQADFDLSLLYRQGSVAVDRRALAHLARALRTMPEHRLPRQLLISLLRDRPWCMPHISPLRHGKAIRAASFSADGQRVVSVGEDYAVRLWETATGKLLGELPPRQEQIKAVNPSPDGRRVAVASFNGTARVWDVLSGKPVGEPMQHNSAVVSISFSADGRRIVTASKDATGRVWDAETGKAINEPIQHEEALIGAAISADGRRVVLLNEGEAKIWDVESGKSVGEELLHGYRILAASFSPDGRRVATACRDKAARIWDADTGAPVGEPALHSDEVVAVSFSPDSRRIATASYDRTARVWDAATGKPVSDWLRHDSKVVAASFSPDGRYVITASEDKTAGVWDAESGRLIREPLRHDSEVVGASFSADGRRILSASSDGVVCIWDEGSGKPVDRFLRQKGTVEAASFSADGRRIVTAGYGDGTARLWDGESGIAVGAPLLHYINRPVPAFSADGRRVVTVCDENSARVWDAETGKPVGELLNHGNHLIAVTFSAGDRHLVTACWSGAVKVWDLATGKLVVESLPRVAGRYVQGFSADGSLVVMSSEEGFFSVWATETGKAVGKAVPRPGTSSIKGMDFSTDHRRMALAFDDWTARIWDLESGELVGAPLLHEYDVYSVSFGAGDTRVVTASRDRTARVWNVNTGQPVSEPMRHADEVFSAKFSGDGTRVVTASLDTTARVWDAQTGKSLGEPFRHKDRVVAASFSADGRRVVTASWDKTAAIWDVAMDVASPLPPWVPELAEALAGQHLDENGLMVPPAKNLAQVREELLGIKGAGADFWSRFGRWFFMRGPQRTISPDSRITVGELEHLQAEAEKERAEKSPTPPPQP